MDNIEKNDAAIVKFNKVSQTSQLQSQKKSIRIDYDTNFSNQDATLSKLSEPSLLPGADAPAQPEKDPGTPALNAVDHVFNEIHSKWNRAPDDVGAAEEQKLGVVGALTNLRTGNSSNVDSLMEDVSDDDPNEAEDISRGVESFTISSINFSILGSNKRFFDKLYDGSWSESSIYIAKIT